MKFVTFYFSGTGNTKWAVEKLRTILKNNGHSSKEYLIEDMQKNTLLSIIKDNIEADFIGFAHPLYGANIPRIMRNFIHDFYNITQHYKNHQKIFLINTYGYVNGHGIFESKKLFINSYCEIYGYLNIKLSDNTPSKKRITAIIGDELNTKIKTRAEKRLNKFVSNAEKSKKYIMGIGPHLLIGKIIRNVLKDEVINNYKLMKIDLDNCSHCMKCVNNCPTNSIQYNDDNFTFSESCEACMRCYQYCPMHCISNSKDITTP